jgi:alpha-N-arabinofuranosidase
LEEQDDGVYLHLTLGPAVRKATTRRVTTALLGKAKIPNLGYENADGTPVNIDYDYFGKKRAEASPCPGPFADLGQGDLQFKVW